MDQVLDLWLPISMVPSDTLRFIITSTGSLALGVLLYPLLTDVIKNAGKASNDSATAAQ